MPCSAGCCCCIAALDVEHQWLPDVLTLRWVRSGSARPHWSWARLCLIGCSVRWRRLLPVAARLRLPRLRGRDGPRRGRSEADSPDRSLGRLLQHPFVFSRRAARPGVRCCSCACAASPSGARPAPRGALMAHCRLADLARGRPVPFSHHPEGLAMREAGRRFLEAPPQPTPQLEVLCDSPSPICGPAQSSC
jgi:hypothetical protein